MEGNFTETLQKCPCCSQQIGLTVDFCPNCAFPFHETEFKQRMHKRSYYKGVGELNEAKSKIKYARNALVIVACLSFLAGIIFFTLNRSGDDGIYYLLIYWILAAIYGTLGWWCNKKPFEASLTGLIVYLSVIILSAIADPASIASGALIKIIIIAVLAGGVKSALKLRREQQNG